MRHLGSSLCWSAALAIACLAVDVPIVSAQGTVAAQVQEVPRQQAGRALPSLEAKQPGVIFGDVFGPLFGDFKSLPSRDTLTWLGAGGVLALVAHPADASTSQGLSSSPGLDTTFEAGQFLGGALFQVAGGMTTYLAGRATGSASVTAVGADLLRAQLLAQTLTFTVKMAARRERPDGSKYSFPSGHASVSFASATVLERHYGWKVGAPAYALATYVAASRIQEERHFLSDVLFGAVIGVVAGRTVTFDVGEHRLAVAPVVVPGGAAVNLHLLNSP